MPVTALTRERGAAAGVAVELRHHDAVELARLGELSATLTASWPVIASTTSSTSWGFVRLRIWASWSISSSSTWRRPAVSTISTSRPCRARLAERPLGDVDRVALGPLLVDGRAAPLADFAELLDRGRALRVAGGERRRVLPCVAEMLGELRAGGRLARALEAGHQDHGRARWRRRRGRGPAPPISSASCSLTTLTTIWPGSRLSSTPAPIARSLTSAMNCLDDLEVDVRLEQRQADLAHRLVDVGLGQLPARAQVGERALEAVGELVEHGLAA